MLTVTVTGGRFTGTSLAAPVKNNFSYLCRSIERAEVKGLEVKGLVVPSPRKLSGVELIPFGSENTVSG